MNDIMIDIETLGTDYNAIITQIGACHFDRYDGEIGGKFLYNVGLYEQIKLGRTVSSGSLKFWFTQPQEHVTWLKEPIPLATALNNLYEWVKAKASKSTMFWSHATFDFPILINAYEMINHKTPFSYRNLRDIRTLVDLSGFKREDVVTEVEKTHNALDDCIRQVEYCVRCFNKLKGENDE